MFIFWIFGENPIKKVYCNNCRQCSEPDLKGSGWITLILFFFYIIPGLIYMIWRRSGLGVCGRCGSDNVIEEKFKPLPIKPKVVEVTIQEEKVRQVNCPDCRELIRFDARKCKHCGSFINQKDTPL